MAISNLTATTYNSGSAATTAPVLTAPTGTVAGTVLITTISIQGGTGITITTLAGWTLIARSNNTTGIGQGVYYKVAGASEPSSYTWTIGSAFASAVCNGYTGVDPNNPIAGFTALVKSTGSTSATFGACIPQAESVYGVLCCSAKGTASVTMSTASASYSINGNTCTTATEFIATSLMDQHTPYVLPLVSVTPGSGTYSGSVTDVDTVVFLRPNLQNNWGLVTDVATFITTLASPVTSAKFGTGYHNEYIFAFVATDGAGTLSETVTITGTTLSWSLIKRTNSASDAGSVEVWMAKAVTPLAFNSEGVTATPSTVSSVVDLAIFSFINCAGAGATNGTSSASGTPNLALTTTAQNSWVWADLFNTSNATAPILGSNQTLVQDYLPSGEGFWNWRETATTAFSGTAVTLNVTAPTAIEYLMTMVEILFANPTGKDMSNLNNTLGANINQGVNRSGTY